MKPATALLSVLGLVFLVAGPGLAQDQERARNQGAQSGEESGGRQPVELPLKYQMGQSCHYMIHSEPHGQGGSAAQESGGQEGARQPSSRRTESQSTGEGMACDHEAWLKVNQVSGGTATLTFTFDASNCEACKQMAAKAGREAPGRVSYTVRADQKGEIQSFEREGAAAGGKAGTQAAGREPSQGQGSWEEILKLQCRQLLGHGLHDQRLEPGKSYDVIWMHPEEWRKAFQSAHGSAGASGGASSSSSSSTQGRSESAGASQATQPNPQLRFEGIVAVRGNQLAYFTIVPGSGQGSSTEPRQKSGASESGSGRTGAGVQGGLEAPNEDAQAGQSGAGEGAGSGQSQSGAGSQSGSGQSQEGRDIGRALFRVQDGFLEGFSLIMPASFMKPEQKSREQGSSAGQGGEGKVVITIIRAD